MHTSFVKRCQDILRIFPNAVQRLNVPENSVCIVATSGVQKVQEALEQTSAEGTCSMDLELDAALPMLRDIANSVRIK